jgi:membrane protease YdiL (CAAX protease family)
VTDRLPVRPPLLAALAVLALAGTNFIWAPVQAFAARLWPDQPALINGLPAVVVIALVGYATVRWGRTRPDGWAVTPDRFIDGWATAGGAALATLPVVVVANLIEPGARVSRPDAEGLPLAVIITVMVVAAPVLEELVFRGWLLGALAPTGLGTVGAVVVSSLVFGAAHVITGVYGWLGFALTTASGLVYAISVVASGSLVPAMIAHAVGNLSAALMLAGYPEQGNLVFQCYLGAFLGFMVHRCWQRLRRARTPEPAPDPLVEER